MILNRKQKEKLVIDLLNQGLTYPQIAKKAHVSFSEIKRIELMVTGDDKRGQDEGGEKEKKAKSIHCQAFELFLQNKSPVQVAIELDLATDQVLKIHSDYQILQNMGKVSRVLMEHKKELGVYLNLLDFINENKIKVKDLNHAVGLAKNMDNLKKEKAQLELDMDTLMDEKKWYEKELDEIKREYYKNR
jgi:hypothetical protein